MLTPADQIGSIRVRWAKGQLVADLIDTPTACKLMEVLPFQAKASRWGDEVYFKTPVETMLEPDAQQVVDPGTVCFWVKGHSLAIPFGPTPVSEAQECRLVEKVNLLGKVRGDPTILRSVQDGDSIWVESAAR